MAWILLFWVFGDHLRECAGSFRARFEKLIICTRFEKEFLAHVQQSHAYLCGENIAHITPIRGTAYPLLRL